METDNWVNDALQHVDDRPVSTENLRERRKDLKAKRRQALPVEADLIERIDQELALIDGQLKAERAFKGVNDTGYRRINLDAPLRWTQGHNLGPRLAVFRLDTPTLRYWRSPGLVRWCGFPILAAVASVFGVVMGIPQLLGVLGSNQDPWTLWFIPYTGTCLAIAAVLWLISGVIHYRSKGISPKLPKELAAPYHELISRHSVGSEHRWNYLDRTAHFVGSIPDHVKAEINRAKKIFGTDIYLVAEVNSWSIKDKTIYNPDPLVIGYKKGLTYLITTFDLVEVEKVVAEEFTE